MADQFTYEITLDQSSSLPLTTTATCRSSFQGCDTELTDKNHWALVCKSRDALVSGFLRTCGCDAIPVELRNLVQQYHFSYHESALVSACCYGYEAAAEDILRTLPDCDRSEYSKVCATALHAAAQNGHAELAREVLQTSNTGYTDFLHHNCAALQVAAMRGHVKVVRVLMDLYDAELKPSYVSFLDQPDDQYYTGTWIALFAACLNGTKDIAEILIGALHQPDRNVNSQRKNDGVTLLMAAAQNGHYDIVSLLLQHHANPRKKMFSPYRCLDAISFAAMNGHLEIVKLLHEFTREKSLTTHLGKLNRLTGRRGVTLPAASEPRTSLTPLQLACRGGHEGVVRYLVSTARMFVAQKDIDEQLMTGLALAQQNGHHAIAKWLTTPKADIEERTPLTHAQRKDVENLERQLRDAKRNVVTQKELNKELHSEVQQLRVEKFHFDKRQKCTMNMLAEQQRLQRFAQFQNSQFIVLVENANQGRQNAEQRQKEAEQRQHEAEQQMMQMVSKCQTEMDRLAKENKKQQLDIRRLERQLAATRSESKHCDERK